MWENLHVLMLAANTSARQLLSEALGKSSSKTLHDARVEGLLDSTACLLHLGLVLIDGRLGSAILEDAVSIRRVAAAL